MTIIAYRPQLENPPRAAEVNISFSLSSAGSFFDILTLESGVNRKVSADKWKLASGLNTVKALMKIGAIQVISESDEDSVVSKTDSSVSEVLDLPPTEALKMIEMSFDESFLRKWQGAEGRTLVKNAINRRLKSISEGNG